METKICSKCGLELPLDQYHKNGFDRYGQQKYRGYCKKCACEKERSRYQDKKTFIDGQKNCCEKCGDTRVYVLDYHHRDKEDKQFTIGKFKKGSFALIQEEIDKCAVLCANCHREFHFLEKSGLTLPEYLGKEI